MLILHDYFRSSASFRVRIALNLKGVPYELKEIHLVNDGGHQLKEEYLKINPQGLVPALIDNDAPMPLTQSLAIIEYLEEKYPNPPLLPTAISDRAKVRAFAQIIACEMHPLNNLRVLKYLTGPLKHSEEEKMQWYFHWLQKGFETLESLLEKGTQYPFSFGNTPTLADICLVPQVYNAQRFEFPLDPFPLIQSINKQCLELKAFQAALP